MPKGNWGKRKKDSQAYKKGAKRGKMKGAKRTERITARDFNDNPEVLGGVERRSYRADEPWERKYFENLPPTKKIKRAITTGKIAPIG